MEITGFFRAPSSSVITDALSSKGIPGAYARYLQGLYVTPQVEVGCFLCYHTNTVRLTSLVPTYVSPTRTYVRTYTIPTYTSALLIQSPIKVGGNVRCMVSNLLDRSRLMTLTFFDSQSDPVRPEPTIHVYIHISLCTYHACVDIEISSDMSRYSTKQLS